MRPFYFGPFIIIPSVDKQTNEQTNYINSQIDMTTVDSLVEGNNPSPIIIIRHRTKKSLSFAAFPEKDPNRTP